MHLLKSKQLYLTDESEVMADQYHPSIKGTDGVGQSIDGLHVQMVSGLVQEEDVGSTECQPGKDHPTTLAVREVPHWADLDMAVNSISSSKQV